eukprot:scaffold6036_cov166-Skeletonema_marinoi.AAC.5
MAKEGVPLCYISGRTGTKIMRANHQENLTEETILHLGKMVQEVARQLATCVLVKLDTLSCQATYPAMQ